MLSNINIERMPSYQMGMETGIGRGGEQMTYTIAERLLQEGCSMDLVTKTTGLSHMDLQHV